MNSVDPNAIKYLVKAKINADGIVDKPDVVGAVFGQTEGLLGDDLDLRDLQKSGRIGRIEVDVTSKGGKSEGIILMYSSLDQVETSIISAAMETIDRVGPCKASVRVLEIEDIRIAKRDKIIERAKELLAEMVEQARDSGSNLATNIRQSVQVDEITTYGKERLPAGPKVKDSEAIIIVEGRSDVLNLLRAGIKNAIAVEGTNIPKTVQDLSRERVTTAFVDGDRGGELILRELFQTSDIDFVARAPRSQEVEELTAKALVKCLRNKVPGDQYMEMNNLRFEESDGDDSEDSNNNYDEDRYQRGRNQRDRRNNNHRSRYSDDDEDGHRNRRDRRYRYSDDESNDRSSRRGQRFDSEASERYKKQNSDDDSQTDDEESNFSHGQEEGFIDSNYPIIREENPSRSVSESRIDTSKMKREDNGNLYIGGDAQDPFEQNTESEKTVDDSEESSPNYRPSKGRGKKKGDKPTIPDQDIFSGILSRVIGTRNAVLLNQDKSEIGKIQVKELAEYIVGSDAPSDIAAIVSDGVIGQRLVDVAAEKNITILIGKKKGKITKLPAEVSVWVKDDFD